MKDISEFTDRELQEELEHRKRIAITPPPAIDNPDFEPLRKMIIDTINSLAKGDWIDKSDFETWVYKDTLQAIYGPKFWDWSNQQNW